MSETVESLILDLLEWLGPSSRPYQEVMAAWRTSCPHLPVWEEAVQRGFIEDDASPGSEPMVSLSARGRDFLTQHRSPKPVEG